MQRDSDKDDRVVCCGDIRLYSKQTQPQIAGKVQIGHQEKKYFLGKWYRSGLRAWGTGGITTPEDVHDSAGQSLS